MRHERLYVVEGRGAFPLDMLRYDSSTPTTAQDGDLAREGLRRRRVALTTCDRRAPTIRRWESFAWRVVEVEGKPPRRRWTRPAARIATGRLWMPSRKDPT